MPFPRLVVPALACALALAGCGAPGDDRAGLAGGAEVTGLPTAGETSRAAAMVDRMTLPELAGQVIVAQYDGTGAPVGLVRRLHLGGVIAFAPNITSPAQIRQANRELTGSFRRPLMIAVDQEGGRVARVLGDATRFPAFMATGAADDTGLTRAAAHGSGSELLGTGFDVVLAPVADVTAGPSDPTIGSRSVGSRPALVSRHVVAATEGLRDAGVVPVLKHFPGHGSLDADSHVELPVQRRSREQLDAIDLAPFRAAIAAGAPAVMTGHIDVRAIDPGVPASVSRKVTTGLLREQLGFRGVVVTDALSMDGLDQAYPGGRGAVAALRAGADVLLKPEDPARARDAIVRAVRDGRLPRRRLEQAATRMLAMLLHRDAGPQDASAPGSQQRSATRLTRAAVTSVAGPCAGRLVGSGIRVVGPAPAADRLRTAARRAGLEEGSGTRVVLIGKGGRPADAAVVVALDTPYVLRSSRARVKLATYADTTAAMRALVEVLLGRSAATGTLPVRVRDLPRTGC